MSKNWIMLSALLISPLLAGPALSAPDADSIIWSVICGGVVGSCKPLY
jgi:hypothetical protein